MRLRHVAGAKEKIDDNKALIVDHEKGQLLFLDERYKDKDIHIEIGMGKGKFIYELAELNPNTMFIGIEKFDSVIVRALEKCIETPLNNLLLLRADAENLKELFHKHSISKIYLNFSDPWPKNRHEKRRLTYKKFLDDYKYILKPGCELHFKTDNIGLFEYSLESIAEYPMNIEFQTTDLHATDKFNVMTEFEEKFSKLGQKICKLTATFKEE